MSLSSVSCSTGEGSINEDAVNPEQYAAAELELLARRWEARDGLLGISISDSFCRSLVDDPVLFLRFMAKNERLYNEWIGSVAHLSFFDIGGCLDRECLRQSMIAALRMSDFPPELLPNRDRLLRQIIEIRVQEVD
jgi:hypothetical protein